MALPRGIRNNNPGNLKITPLKWKGKIPFDKNTDGVFEQFETMAYGIRAMLIDLKGDIEKDGLNTITKVINEYAPPSENLTSNYINLVSKQMGIGPNTVFKADRDTLIRLGSAITGVENGWSYQLPISKIMEGYDLIGGGVGAVVDTAKRNPKTTLGIIALLAIGGYYVLNE
jgi:hypothetical protein